MTGDQTRRVADELRAAIEAGEFGPGSKLPSGEEIAERYGVHRGTAMKSVRALAADGYVEIRGRQGAYVRERPRSRIVVRDRTVYRDEIGYFFDQNAKDWVAIEAPTRGLAVPPDHVADILGVPRGQDVLVRDRRMGPPTPKQVLQLASSYIPVALVGEIPALGAEKPGPGGIYDRAEEYFKAPISWDEAAWTRSPTEEEQAALKISKAIPVLVVTRTSHIRRGDETIAIEVNETRMSGERFALAYQVQRDSSAAWPRTG
ncbi:GntR family transcriptional regulator [Kitasatospora kifunensis]|uniref:GntR family transcriptional regulator n=1 Tax=Kitasatospora kifunensis TaxID=58351 RepID=A0A7W7QYN4_KITKI|nr:GntR family transcriptional regulator [Kitasatospora kifunensis]MBB4922232.1 GntR family transcriptional regulator [Kitasatospora kifunensis]